MKKEGIRLIDLIFMIIAIVTVVTIVININKNNNKKEDKPIIQEASDDSNISTPIPTIKYENEVPILCYHGVSDKASGIQELFVKEDCFEEQMKYLDEEGYTTLFVSEIEEANKYEKPVIITFDDGYESVYTNAFPILEKYKLKANVYAIGKFINENAYISEDMIKAMVQSSLIEIGSHTVNHRELAELSDEEIEYELSESKKSLKKLTNKDIKVVAYPTGSYDDRVMNIAKKHYKYGLSVEEGKENPNKLNKYDLRRIYVGRSYNIEKFKSLL